MVNVVQDRSMTGLRAGFVQFANTVFAENTPLYRALSLGVAESADLLALAARTRVGQYPPYILFASVHHLLLADDREPLADYYPTLHGSPLPAGEALPVFLEFCRRRERELKNLVSSRLVQTNEVGRSACLAPAFAHVSRRVRQAPLYLIDIGAAAGLNLLFDRYLLDYGRFMWGDSSSRVRISCVLGDSSDSPLAGWKPNVAHRIGVDLSPIDVTSDDEARWLKALIWPDRPERVEVLTQAIAVAKEDPPEVIAGDAVALLDELLAGVPADETPCVYQSYSLEYVSEDAREEFRRKLDLFGARRDLFFVEMSGIGEGANMRLTSWRDGERAFVQLAQCQPHGQWLKWLLPSGA